MNIICEVCQKEFTPTAGAQAREYAGFTEYGVECPGCKKWTHAYYMTPQLEQEQRQLMVKQERHQAKQTAQSWQHYQFQLSAYKRAYNATQQRIARKVGKHATVAG